MLLFGSMVFAMGAAAGCGDDDDGDSPDAPVVTFDGPTAADARTFDATSTSFDARVTDATPRD